MNIKDSGERRTFSTGAQRDRAGGKGRMDLLPWNAIEELANVADDNLEWLATTDISSHASLGMKYGGRYLAGWTDKNYLALSGLHFLYALECRYMAAIGVSPYSEVSRDELFARFGYIDNEGQIVWPEPDYFYEELCEGYYDLLPWNALIEVSKIFEAGAIKYAARNWERGMPIDEYLDSGLRHGAKFLGGWNDENHLAQAAWNMVCALDTRYQIAIGELPSSLGVMARQRVEPLENVGLIKRNPEYWEAA